CCTSRGSDELLLHPGAAADLPGSRHHAGDPRRPPPARPHRAKAARSFPLATRLAGAAPHPGLRLIWAGRPPGEFGFSPILRQLSFSNRTAAIANRDARRVWPSATVRRRSLRTTTPDPPPENPGNSGVFRLLCRELIIQQN